MEVNNNRRLWIGNLDPKITEYQLLKALQKFGELEKFDLSINHIGPNLGKSKGYAFVSYKNEVHANKAMQLLNGQLFGSKRIYIQLANSEFQQINERPKTSNPFLNLSALAGPRRNSQNRNSIQLNIQMIEKKLKSMETTDHNFAL